MSKDVYRVGLIGCGTISDAYIRGLRVFPWLEVTALSDIDLGRAEAKAEKYGVAKGYSVEELLADDEVDIAVNLTVPTVHAEVSLNALGASKHVYSEKPLAITREDGKAILEAADANNLRLGCAPDTFMGGGIQTCRKLVDEGAVGEPLSASAFMLGHGVELWHPSPFFFFKYGGHPLFDMGPYYLTAPHQSARSGGVGRGPHHDGHPPAHRHKRTSQRHGHHGGRAGSRDGDFRTGLWQARHNDCQRRGGRLGAAPHRNLRD